MCSNTSSGSYGDLQDEYFGSCRKKQKKDKVRRRGPGVAELEKIRLQQENKSPLPSLSLPNFDHTLFPPPATDSDGCDLVMMPPNFALPSYFANGSFPKDLIPPAPVFQRKQQHSLHHQAMKLQNPSQGSGGFYQFIELPSNQRSSVDNVSQILEEENKIIISAKRPLHFLTNTTKASLGPSITISRDLKQNRSLDKRLISPVQDSGTTICNTIAIDFDENIQWRRKPFYSFITSDDRSNGDRKQQARDRYESASDHGIDLSLKL